MLQHCAWCYHARLYQYTKQTYALHTDTHLQATLQAHRRTVHYVCARLVFPSVVCRCPRRLGAAPTSAHTLPGLWAKWVAVIQKLPPPLTLKKHFPLPTESTAPWPPTTQPGHQSRHGLPLLRHGQSHADDLMPRPRTLHTRGLCLQTASPLRPPPCIGSCGERDAAGSAACRARCPSVKHFWTCHCCRRNLPHMRCTIAAIVRTRMLLPLVGCPRIQTCGRLSLCQSRLQQGSDARRMRSYTLGCALHQAGSLSP